MHPCRPLPCDPARLTDHIPRGTRTWRPSSHGRPARHRLLASFVFLSQWSTAAPWWTTGAVSPSLVLSILSQSCITYSCDRYPIPGTQKGIPTMLDARRIPINIACCLAHAAVVDSMASRRCHAVKEGTCGVGIKDDNLRACL